MPEPTKTRRCPSGDQESWNSSSPFVFVSCVTPVPSAFITKMSSFQRGTRGFSGSPQLSQPSKTKRTKAIFRPSGDQTGFESLP
jgi:hypothetical protein